MLLSGNVRLIMRVSLRLGPLYIVPGWSAQYHNDSAICVPAVLALTAAVHAQQDAHMPS